MRPARSTSQRRSCPSARRVSRPRACGRPYRASSDLARWTGEAGEVAGGHDYSSPRSPICERVLGPEHPDTLTTRGNLARYDRGGGGCGRGPRPVRRAAAHPRAGPGPRAPRHPDRPRQSRSLDWGSGGCGRGPRPVPSAVAHPRAGPPAPSTQHTLTARANLARWTGKRGMRPGPATSTQRCCPSASGSPAPSTHTP